jgi:4-amino-4-deoxy-L-arabinose transferase-like glycosyltransferase
MTGLLDGLLAVLVAGLLNLFVLYQIRARSEATETTFLLQVYSWTILLRYSLAIALNIFAANLSFAAAFWGDSGSYDIGGLQLSLKWSGEPITTTYMLHAVSGYGWVYVVGALYYVFGRNQLLVQMVNGLVGGLTVLVIYAIAARLFGRPAARWAALFMAFFPQMVFWSTGMYKDPPILLCIALAMFAVLRLRERLSVGMVVVFLRLSLLGVALISYLILRNSPAREQQFIINTELVL